MKSISKVDPFMQIKDPECEGIIWYSPLNTNLFNAYGSECFYEGDYARLSKKQRKQVKPISESVEWLSKHSSGLQLKFKTDSTRILIDVELRAKHDMCHMPATGQCGFDLYVYDEKLQEYVLHNTAKYPIKQRKYRVELSSFYIVSKEMKMRSYIINFPLYQGVKSLRIGFDENSITLPVSFNNEGKIVLYGTSIAQGGCVSRPGLMYSNILSRWLDIEFINQGYSGSAMLEPIMGEFMGQFNNQKLLIIDAEANAGCDMTMEQNLEQFIRNYKKYSPNTPILIVSRCLFNLDLFVDEKVELNIHYKKYIKKLIKKLKDEGHQVCFLDGSKFFKDKKFNYSEFTVDGVHPTDFGNYLFAKYHYEAIKKILK